MIYIFGAAFDPPHVGHFSIIKALLHFKNPEKIIILPSGKRNDKDYHASLEQRKELCRIFVQEINDKRVVLDCYFLEEFLGEMITKDVDYYVREKYREECIHVFGSDTLVTMPNWDNENYALKKIKKLIIPRADQD